MKLQFKNFEFYILTSSDLNEIDISKLDWYVYYIFKVFFFKFTIQGSQLTQYFDRLISNLSPNKY